MPDETKNRLYIISVALGILVAATGAWTTVVVRGTDISNNKAVNEKQEVVILATSSTVSGLETRFEVHQAESATIQKNMEKMQGQIDKGIQIGTDRFIEILERLPKK